jgi:hypothetical protein
MRRALAVAALCALTGLPWLVRAQRTQPHAYVPPNGFVPDSVTAVRIAVAVWTPIYGERQIRDEAPYRARLRDSIWTVEGSLPRGEVGGLAVAEIAKRDGRILRVSHGK